MKLPKHKSTPIFFFIGLCLGVQLLYKEDTVIYVVENRKHLDLITESHNFA